jgi:hypothetical protein
MDRQEIKNRIVEFFRKQSEPTSVPLHHRHQIQMGNLYELVGGSSGRTPPYNQDAVFAVVREVVQELINSGFLYPGLPSDKNSGYPWLTITEYGKQAFLSQAWLPYDPDGYLKALKEKVPEIDDVTFVYIGESVAAFNRRHLLSATVTLGVASENLMLLLIEAYLNWLKDAKCLGSA